MQFTAKTAAPAGKTEQEKKQDEIRDLLFKAVMLYVEDNETARQELLELLGMPEASDTAA